MAFKRKFKESPMPQGPDEEVAYDLDTAPWGGTPTVPVVVVKQAGRDVSADVLSGTASITSDVITTPLVQSLTKGKVYRLEIKFTIDGNVLEAFGDIHCDDEE